jgi:hypothetical protein
VLSRNANDLLRVHSFDAFHSAAMKPGVSWPDMHRLMWRVLLEASSLLLRPYSCCLVAGYIKTFE